jgi:hypothetical protein
VEDVKQKSIYAMRWKIDLAHVKNTAWVETDQEEYELVLTPIDLKLARHIVRLHNASLKAKE